MHHVRKARTSLIKSAGSGETVVEVAQAKRHLSGCAKSSKIRGKRGGRASWCEIAGGGCSAGAAFFGTRWRREGAFGSVEGGAGAGFVVASSGLTFLRGNARAVARQAARICGVGSEAGVRGAGGRGGCGGIVRALRDGGCLRAGSFEKKLQGIWIGPDDLDGFGAADEGIDAAEEGDAGGGI